MKRYSAKGGRIAHRRPNKVISIHKQAVLATACPSTKYTTAGHHCADPTESMAQNTSFPPGIRWPL